MIEQEQREAVVREALSWVRTPFVWEACAKGVGVDCGRFLAGVFNEAGVKKIDIPNLPRLIPLWFMHRSNESYLNIIRQFAVEYKLQPKQQPRPGDIIVVKQARDWAHSAIVISWPKIIGSAYGYCVTVWQNIHTSPQYMNREIKYFNPWDEKAGGNL